MTPPNMSLFSAHNTTAAARRGSGSSRTPWEHWWWSMVLVVAVLSLVGQELLFSQNDQHRHNVELFRRRWRVPHSTSVIPGKNSTATESWPWASYTNDTVPQAVFYNVYIAPESTNPQRRAERLFRDQIRRVGPSFANRRAWESSLANRSMSLVVYYNTIGPRDAWNASFVHEICTRRNHLTCVHLAHYDHAQEVVTLQRLYEYCRVYPRHRVTYMHNKGSLHRASWQNDNRRRMTEAVVSAACVQPFNPTCNVCGRWFVPFWGPIVAGNFWTATCAYVRRLVPPTEIQARMEELQQRVQQQRQQQDQQQSVWETSRVLTPGPYAWGTDRYSLEHWIGTHPSLVPCDVMDWNKQQLKKLAKAGVAADAGWMDDTQQSSALSVTNTTADPYHHLAPSRPWDTPRYWYNINDTKIQALRENPHWRRREYFLLPGYLYRCWFLYQQFPPSSSWAWRWYPDRDWWSIQTQLRGIPRVLEVVLGINNLSSSSSSSHSSLLG